MPPVSVDLLTPNTRKRKVGIVARVPGGGQSAAIEWVLMFATDLHLPPDGVIAESPPIDTVSGLGAYCREHHLSLTQVAAHGWLVREEPGSGAAGRLLACVEERGPDFEVMEVGGGFRWTTFPTLEKAVEHLIPNESAAPLAS
ncbi:MAG: hypothetical protein V4531_03850 [Actinomycetota bacterium]